MPPNQNQSPIKVRNVISPWNTSKNRDRPLSEHDASQILFMNSVPFPGSGCVVQDMWTEHFHSSLSVYNGSTLLVLWITCEAWSAILKKGIRYNTQPFYSFWKGDFTDEAFFILVFWSILPRCDVTHVFIGPIVFLSHHHPSGPTLNCKTTWYWNLT